MKEPLHVKVTVILCIVGLLAVVAFYLKEGFPQGGRDGLDTFDLIRM